MANVSLCLARPSSGLNPDIPVLLHTEKPHIPPNSILLAVDRFGWSANNVTYQALGEAPHFRYFDFHASPESKDNQVSAKTHGLVPVWGFATVVESSHPKIHAGERVYGYLAPCRYLLLPVSPSDVNKYSFYVPRPHLPAGESLFCHRRPYNQIQRCAADTQYDPSPEIEDLTMLYRPLFWTSYWCEDWMFSTSYRGAKRVLISSASSKTAFCLAYVIRKRVAKGDISGIKVVGLTSKGNVAFTKGLGLYDEVVDYDTFAESSALRSNGEKWIYADVAGRDALNAQVNEHFASTGTTLVTTIALGMSNLSPTTVAQGSIDKWKTNQFGKDAPPTPVEQFFMVEWLNVRKHELKPTDMFKMQNVAWKELIHDCPGWVQVERVSGADAVKKAYERMAKGGLGPDKGFIWSLWDDPSSARPKL